MLLRRQSRKAHSHAKCREDQHHHDAGHAARSRESVEAGEYASTSEALRDAVRVWHRQRLEDAERLNAIRARATLARRPTAGFQFRGGRQSSRETSRRHRDSARRCGDLKFAFRPEALDHLEDIYRLVYRASLSPAVAEGFLRRIRERCRRIGDVPHGGRLRDDLEPGLRAVPFVFFTVAGTTRRSIVDRARRRTRDPDLKARSCYPEDHVAGRGASPTGFPSLSA